MSFYVYLLECTSGATYVGATVDLDRRLRQHNKEIKGGAKATSAKVVKGETWKRVCYVENFPDWSAALQFEWAWKFQSRQLRKRESKTKKYGVNPLDRRKEALNNLLASEKPTSKSVCYSEWEIPPNVVWEDNNV